MLTFTSSPLWDPLTRYFYKKSFDNDGDTKVTDETKKQLMELSVKLRASVFDIDGQLSLMHGQLVNSVMNHLDWYGDHPVFELHLNNIRFKRAVAAVGCYGDLNLYKDQFLLTDHSSGSGSGPGSGSHEI
ncbi:unnamed protein product [Ambrosiozyma monospora]|uniref:Unnamed protein product n=1 Tax=Ambrosiozyma monospora TaxID=43982 RepID=A0ACB5TJG9_AMBMO|nr:unnamed protein product [Ambrosiozyma monospora]